MSAEILVSACLSQHVLVKNRTIQPGSYRLNVSCHLRKSMMIIYEIGIRGYVIQSVQDVFDSCAYVIIYRPVYKDVWVYDKGRI